MRMSSQENDPGYQAWSECFAGHHINVFLDGAEVIDCATADDVEGFVVRLKHGDDGSVVVIDDEIVYETVHGLVEIRVTPR